MSSAVQAVRGLGEITHRRILRTALPIVLSNATVPILGAVDTGVVGQLGTAAPIGAVGIGAMVLSAVYWIFGFLRMGTTGLTARARGAGQHGEVAAMLTRAVMIGLLGGMFVIATQIWLFQAAFWLAPTSSEVEGLSRTYLQIRVWSAPAAIALYGLTGWLIAQERTRAVLVIQLWMNGINILLDLWFVLGLDWGVGGVAVATVIAEISGFLLAAWMCRDVFDNPAWKERARIFDRVALHDMAMVNRDILLRSLMLQAIFMSFLFLGADFGDVTLAANQVLLQFLSITGFALDGFAFAVEALVGQAFGARDRAAFRKASLMSSFWGVICVLGLALIFALAGGTIIDMMSTSAEVRLEARVFLPWMVAAPIFGVAAWMLDGIFIGATQGKDMRNMMFLSLLVYLAALGALMPFFGNHGLWAALLISFVARGLTLGARYTALEKRVGA